MAEPINIQIDPLHLRQQITSILDKEFENFSIRLRMAADCLDPGFEERQGKWIEDSINSKVEARLRLKEDK